MDLRVGYARPGPIGIDTEAPSVADAMAAQGAHAVGRGSLIALCGAPVEETEDPWPPSGPPCPLCSQTVKGYVR